MKKNLIFLFIIFIINNYLYSDRIVKTDCLGVYIGVDITYQPFCTLHRSCYGRVAYIREEPLSYSISGCGNPMQYVRYAYYKETDQEDLYWEPAGEEIVYLDGCPGQKYIYIGNFIYTGGGAFCHFISPSSPYFLVTIVFNPEIGIEANDTMLFGGNQYSIRGYAKCGDNNINEPYVEFIWYIEQNGKSVLVGGGSIPKLSIPITFPDGSKLQPGQFDLKLVVKRCNVSKETKKTFIWNRATPTPGPNEHPTPDCDTTKGNPIYIFTGEKYDEVEDISLKSTGYNLEFKRIYRSGFISDTYQSNIGKIGIGWRTNYDYNLKETEEFLMRYSSGYNMWHTIYEPKQDTMKLNNLTVYDPPTDSETHKGGFILLDGQKIYPDKFIHLFFPDGAKHVFRAKFLREENGEPVYEKAYTIPGKPWKIVKQDNPVFTYKLIKGREVYCFDNQGRLTAMQDLAGKGVTISYNGSNTLVTDNYGRSLNIEKDSNGNIYKITAPDGEYLFEYSNAIISPNPTENYFLIKVDRPGKEDAEYGYLDFTYYLCNFGDLSYKKDFKTTTGYKEVWYGVDCDIRSISYRKYRYEKVCGYTSNKLIEITYNPDGSVTVKDKEGEKTYYFNSFGSITRINSAQGTEIREYDEIGRLKKIKYMNGTEEMYFYDEEGNIREVITTWSDPLEGGIRTKREMYEYDANGNMTKYIDGENNVTQYIYDSNNKIKFIVQGGRETSYSYYPDGNLKVIYDSENLSKTYTYDNYGNVATIKNNATGGIEYFSYDIAGKLSSHVGEDGVTKIYTYDENFPSKVKRIQINGADGSETINYTYDERGNLILMQDAMGTVEYGYYSIWNESVDLLSYEIDRAGGRKDYFYDKYRRIKQITDNSGGSKIYTYNAFGYVESIQDGRGQITRYNYDIMGNRTAVIDRNGKVTRYIYDGLGRLRKIVDAKNVEIIYDYDKIGNRIYIKDGNGNETRYEYDEYSRMIKEIFADNSYIKYSYSLEGDLKKREVYDASGSLQKTQNYIYDNGHRLLNDGIYSYTYGAPSCSCANRIETVTDVRGVTRYEYDYKGRVKKTIYPDGTTVESIYNDSAKTKTVKLDGNVIFILNLDGEGRASGTNAIIEQVGGGNNVFSITRDNAGRIKEVIYPNEDRSVTEYDAEGRIVKHKNYYKTHIINKFEFTLDGEGNKMTEKTILGTRNYGYDDIYQLTRAKYERGQAFTWKYDAAGNRLLSDEMGDSKTYVPNNLNQYASVNGVSYSYDADGNLLSDGVRSMGWDIRNRLIQVTKQGKTIKYTYDHNDLRVEKEVDGVKTKYYYDGSLLLCEKDTFGKVQKVYINDGEGIIGMIRYIYDNTGVFSHYQRLYYMYDSLGSVSVITGENGLPLQNYTYSPYGSTMNVEYDSVNNLRFVGRYGGYKDDDTGLTYFWHRWYDERDGRWVSRDMIGTCGGINIYKYANNTPNVVIDYAGLIGTYGNWCGGGWSGGTIYGEPDFNGPYVDDLDLCCREHDRGWYNCEKKEEKQKCLNIPEPNSETLEQCKERENKEFCKCLKTVKFTADIYKDIYLILAKRIFCK